MGQSLTESSRLPHGLSTGCHSWPISGLILSTPLLASGEWQLGAWKHLSLPFPLLTEGIYSYISQEDSTIDTLLCYKIKYINIAHMSSIISDGTSWKKQGFLHTLQFFSAWERVCYQVCLLLGSCCSIKTTLYKNDLLSTQDSCSNQLWRTLYFFYRSLFFS